MEKWLTDLSIDDLKGKIIPKPKVFIPFSVNEIPVFMNLDNGLISPDEEFRPHKKFPISVSNYGRIRFGDKILLQRPDETKTYPYGYLWIEIPNISKYQLVYRLVAEVWCERPTNTDIYNTVHHISNNGTDNRPLNLLWVTDEQHAEIHPWLKNFNKKPNGI